MFNLFENREEPFKAAISFILPPEMHQIPVVPHPHQHLVVTLEFEPRFKDKAWMSTLTTTIQHCMEGLANTKRKKVTKMVKTAKLSQVIQT